MKTRQFWSPPDPASSAINEPAKPTFSPLGSTIAPRSAPHRSVSAGPVPACRSKRASAPSAPASGRREATQKHSSSITRPKELRGDGTAGAMLKALCSDDPADQSSTPKRVPSRSAGRCARPAAHALHARYHSRDLTRAARATFVSRFGRLVDPDGQLDPAERTRRGRPCQARLTSSNSARRAARLGGMPHEPRHRLGSLRLHRPAPVGADIDR